MDGAAEPGADPRLAGSSAEICRRVGGHELRIHIFPARAPAAGGARPGILFFHGGGWEDGTPAQFGEQCRYLAGRGLVALTAEYRVRSRHGTGPWECLEDAAAAMVWARDNAARLGLDPTRLAAGGGSAGGHLAACLGTCPLGDPAARADAMVLFNPVLDVRGPKWAGRFAPRGPEGACPLLHVGPETPPAIVLHGRADAVAPAADSEAFAAAVRSAGGRCELRLYDGAGHGFFNYARRSEGFYEETLREADRFLASLGFLSGEPTI